MDFLHDKKGVIVAVDGGICSQIHMCAIGLKFAKMGYNVKYDLSFFEDTSMDSNSSIESTTTLDFKATLKSNSSLNSNTTLDSKIALDSNANTDSNISIESNTIAVDTGGGGEHLENIDSKDSKNLGSPINQATLDSKQNAQNIESKKADCSQNSQFAKSTNTQKILSHDKNLDSKKNIESKSPNTNNINPSNLDSKAESALQHTLKSLKRFQNGKDVNGIFARNYDMPLAFPSLNLPIATHAEITHYKAHHNKTQSHPNPYNPFDFTPPAYFGPYFSVAAYLEFQEDLKERFDPLDKDSIKPLITQILESNSCAVHVRRGDVSGYSIYGYPPSEQYFIDAVNIVNKLDSDVVFYFFSDEPDFVTLKIAPKLRDINYHICTQNGSDKGYLDLYAISRCKHIIASHGSLGYFGKFLNVRKEAKSFFIMPKYHKECFKMYENCILLGNDSLCREMPPQDSTEKNTKKKVKFINILRLKVYNYLHKKLAKRGLV